MAGFVHVYTGDGKGKTTAALGLALRAAGAGWQVLFAQFGKTPDTSELTALNRYSDRICVRQYGPVDGPEWAHRPDTLSSAQLGLSECKEALASGRYRMVILDEANVGPMLNLFSVDQILELIDARSEEVELVITGRYAHPRVISRADLVTEMREVKHYYRRGVLARVGIER